MFARFAFHIRAFESTQIYIKLTGISIVKMFPFLVFCLVIISLVGIQVMFINFNRSDVDSIMAEPFDWPILNGILFEFQIFVA
mmetsp:Transcript_8235/g.11405  ORF Transcript_8235/g.11405 Transcript_8235/m.11405 type:complete len:83 (+) Transcript_8235:1227-1475(+)